METDSSTGARLRSINTDQDKALYNMIFFLLHGISSCPVPLLTRKLFFFFFKLQLLLLLSLNPQIKDTSCTFPMNQGKPTVLAKLLRCRNKQDVCNTQKGPAMNKDKIWVWKAYLRRGGKLPRCRNCWHVLTHAHLSLWQEVWGFRSLSFRLLFWFLQSNFN